MKRRSATIRTILLVLCVLVTGYLLIRGAMPARQTSLQPILLERVQALGDLHTARYNFSRTFHHRTSLEPTGIASVVPGAATLVHSATRNKALVSVVGSVEAGIDMRKAKIERGVNGWTIRLPRPVVYAPTAKARVDEMKSGMFWLDPNIGLKAEHLAANQFRVSAIEGGIREVAKAEAEKRVRELLTGFTKEPIQVRFEA